MLKNLFGQHKRRLSLPKHVRMPSLPSLLEDRKAEVPITATPPEYHKQLSFFRQRRKSEPTAGEIYCATTTISFLPPSSSFIDDEKKSEPALQKKAQTDESAIKSVSSNHKHSRRKSEPLLVKVMPLMQIKEDIEDISITDVLKLEALAKRGCQEAQARLGYYYLRDDVDVPDKIKAKYWLELAIHQNPKTSAAHWVQGLMYLEGFIGSIGLSYKHMAFGCFVKAADRGHAGALYSLGVCYWQGTGTIQNRAEAFKMFKEAADKNWAEAQFMVGMHYFIQLPPQISFLDEETNAILTRATCYFRLAAVQGNKNAINKLKAIQKIRDQIERKKIPEGKAASEQVAHFCCIL